MTAIIIGGGIAGCATALALHREGIASEIHEAREVASDGVGSFLTLAVNGVHALAELGVDAAEAGGMPTPRMQLALRDGVPLTTFPMGDGTRSVRRAALYGLLQRAVADAGIPVHLGHALVGADLGGQHPTAQFADGSSATGDLLVGADGIGSRLRVLLDPRAPRARYLGLLNTGGFARDVAVPSEPGTMHMMFGSRTFFSWLAGDDGEVWWFANPNAPQEPSRAASRSADAAAWRARLLDLLEGDDPVATRVLQASDEPLAPWPMYDFPRVPVWRRGSAVIVGDAAHAASPSSGQGASMAIEDAVALGRLVGASDRTPGGIARALAQYESLRRPRVERVIRQGKRSSGGKSPGPLGRAIRDRMLRAYFGRPRPATDQSWLWEYRVTVEVERVLAG